jgi:hypothetical protein
MIILSRIFMKMIPLAYNNLKWSINNLTCIYQILSFYELCIHTLFYFLINSEVIAGAAHQLSGSFSTEEQLHFHMETQVCAKAFSNRYYVCVHSYIFLMYKGDFFSCFPCFVLLKVRQTKNKWKIYEKKENKRESENDQSKKLNNG